MQDKYTQISSFLYGRNNKCKNLIKKISFVIAIKTWLHLARSLYEDNFNEEHEATKTGKHIVFLVGMILYYDDYLEIYLAIMLFFGSHFSFPLRSGISPLFTWGDGEPQSLKFFQSLIGTKLSGELGHSCLPHLYNSSKLYQWKR